MRNRITPTAKIEINRRGGGSSNKGIFHHTDQIFHSSVIARGTSRKCAIRFHHQPEVTPAVGWEVLVRADQSAAAAQREKVLTACPKPW